MNISNAWLREYVAHDLTPDALADTLTMAGLEVESVETVGPTFDGVVVGRVDAVRPHPNADRLTLCTVDLGDDEPVQIVCGAPNVAAGQLVPVATVGTTLRVPDRNDPSTRVPLKLKKAKIRGEVSRGMICAEDELGLSDDHSGILVLDDHARPGEPFAAYLERAGRAAGDAVLDIAITPNRPDATSHLGVARDLAALTGRPLHAPDVEVPQTGGEIERHVRVRIDSPEGCGRYVAMLVRGVRIAESPDWLKRRLEAVGLRPRNNVVDVTNYVMYACGQPLHAFDFAELAEGTIVVRATEAESSFTTLDDKERRLPAGTLMIRDAERDVAIAGVMGGQNSEVGPDTTDVLIESAYFDPAFIRRTAKALGLQTDASYRFERGVDPAGQAWAAAYAAALIVELAGGTLVPGLVDAHPRPVEPRVIRLRPERVRRILGVHVPVSEITRLLTAIGFAVAADAPSDPEADRVTGGAARALQCTVPTFRPDVEREIDVIEEIARLYGYDNVPLPAHTIVPYAPPRPHTAGRLRRRARQFLRGRGFREVYTNSLLPHDLAERYSTAPPVTTVNAVSQEMTTLRPRLLPGVLRVVAHNQRHGRTQIRLAEFGHVFARTDKPGALIPGYREREHLLLAVSGPVHPAAWDTGATETRPVDLFDLRGELDALAAALGVANFRATPLDPTDLAEAPMAVRVGKRTVGNLGRLTDAEAERLDLTAPVYFAEFDWDALVEIAGEQPPAQYAPVSRFPVVERDLALLVDTRTPAGEVLETVHRSGGQLLQETTLFDVYEGDQVEAGRKSLALRLRFGADRTLVDTEVDRQIERILEALEERHGATLR